MRRAEPVGIGRCCVDCYNNKVKPIREPTKCCVCGAEIDDFDWTVGWTAEPLKTGKCNDCNIKNK